VRRVAAAAAVVVGLALVVGVGAAPAVPSQPTQLAVQQVLDARATAVKNGERAAFLATVDPGAPASFRAAQSRQFDGLLSVPLASYSLTARLDDTGDLAAAAGLSARYGGAPVYLPETRLRFRFLDYDDREDVESLFLTFVQRAGRWYIGGDDDLASLGLLTARFIWDQGPVRVNPTPHFVVVSHPEDAARADALATIAEDAMTALNARWDQPWYQRIPLVLPHSIDELAALLQSTFDLTNFVAFVNYGAVRDNGFEPTAPRIYVQDRNLARYGRDFQVQTLTHELDHAAASALAGPLIPSWVHEGVADWIATGRSTTERKPRGSDGVLPRDYQFVTGGGAAILRSYGESRSAISYLASRFGLGAPSRFFAVLGAARVVAGDADYQTDAALRAMTGVGLADLIAGWARR
jgi:hypothetical protein